MKIVAVTAWPTGVAHPLMAAKAASPGAVVIGTG
jgi:fructose-specific phosphotransferase system component IIB